MLPVVGGEDSTVVGISEWSPAGCERVGGYPQSECVSERQGMCYLMHPPKYTTFCHKELPIQTCTHNPTLPKNSTHRHTLLLLHFTACETLHALAAPNTCTWSVVIAQHVIDILESYVYIIIINPHTLTHHNRHSDIIFSSPQCIRAAACIMHNVCQ